MEQRALDLIKSALWSRISVFGPIFIVVNSFAYFILAEPDVDMFVLVAPAKHFLEVHLVFVDLGDSLVTRLENIQIICLVFVEVTEKRLYFQSYFFAR
jgi:hypothetical protein